MSASPISGRDEAEKLAESSAVQAVRGGDRDAFRQLVELYQTRLFALTLMMVRDPAGAEEVTQDAFVTAFRRLELYDESRRFYPWIATIAVRLAQTWLRRRNRTERPTLDMEPEVATSLDPLSELISDERGRNLWRLVEALPSGERTAVYLYYRQEMKLGDIALALGVTSGTVKTLLFRARQHLRRTIDKLEEKGQEV